MRRTDKVPHINRSRYGDHPCIVVAVIVFYLIFDNFVCRHCNARFAVRCYVARDPSAPKRAAKIAAVQRAESLMRQQAQWNKILSPAGG